MSTQLFALGIIGEYLARMHYRSMERLPYVVRVTAHNGDSSQSRVVAIEEEKRQVSSLAGNFEKDNVF